MFLRFCVFVFFRFFCSWVLGFWGVVLFWVFGLWCFSCLGGGGGGWGFVFLGFGVLLGFWVLLGFGVAFGTPRSPRANKKLHVLVLKRGGGGGGAGGEYWNSTPESVSIRKNPTGWWGWV